MSEMAGFPWLGLRDFGSREAKGNKGMKLEILPTSGSRQHSPRTHNLYTGMGAD